LLALNMLEGSDLRALGHNSAAYIHLSAEATKLAMADRDKYFGDTDFVTIPYPLLLAKSYATERRKLIDPDKASRAFRPGSPDATVSGAPPPERPTDLSLRGDADHEGDTSYLSVMDRNRNAVSFTPSLHSGFGTGVVMGDLGFSFNCRGDY